MKKYIDIGNRIKKLRGDVSQKEFAKKIGVSFAAYQNYEYGKRIPPAHILSKIADTCGMNVDWILSGTANIETARMYESINKKFYFEDLLKLLEKLVEREEKLKHKYVKGRAAEKEELIYKEEKDFVEYLRDWIDQQKNLSLIGGEKTLYRMYKKIERILKEGDSTKINILEGVLKSLDPGKKKNISLLNKSNNNS